MNYEKKIQNLTFENEFLQQQIEELNEILINRDTEQNLPIEGYQSEGWLRSQIECNKLEIQQLQYNMEESIKKAAAIETMNEALENDLLISYKAHQKDKTIIKELTSTQVYIEVVNEELNQTSALFKKVKALKADNAELQSDKQNTELQNKILQEKLKEANDLLLLYKKKIVSKDW